MASALNADRRPSPIPFTPVVGEPLAGLRRAFDGAPNGIVIAAPDGAIVYTNPLAGAIFGYQPGELIGQPLAGLLPGPRPELPDEQWSQLQAGAEQPTMAGPTVAGMRRDGSMVPLEIGLSTVVEGTSKYVVASVLDVSERYALEARLAAATHTHLALERLVADVAARFSTTLAADVEAATVDSLGEIVEALHADCAVLWHQRPGDSHLITTVHAWTASGCPPLPESLAAEAVGDPIARLAAGKPCAFTSPNGLPSIGDRELLRLHGLQAGVFVPLPPPAGEQPERGLMVLAVGCAAREREWPPEVVERLRLIAGVMSQAFARRTEHLALQDALDEIRRLRDRLASEAVELRREVKVLRTSHAVAAESPSIRQVLAQVEQVAPTPATVLLLGETGTGKEVMAQTIHDLSPRHQRQMIRVSCAAIPTALIESELFGRERGAYTGALSRQIGRFEAANQSTIFLDEIGELPMEVQVKLLRVLQERTIERLGSTTPIKVDVRVIAATNRNLEDAVRDKTFREDLFYRLNVFPVVVPPLRERLEDIPALIWSFVDEFSRLFGKTIDSISKDSMRELQRYPWPGNVRELRNVVERAVIVATDRQLVIPAPRAVSRSVPQGAMTLSALEIEHIRTVLESTNWRIRGVGGAAMRLGLKPTTLESRMARLGITRKKMN